MIQPIRKLIPAASVAAVVALVVVAPVGSSVAVERAGKSAKKKTAKVKVTLSATRNADRSVTARAVLRSKQRACIKAVEAKTNVSRASGVFFDLPASFGGRPGDTTPTEPGDAVPLARVGPRVWEAVVPASHPLHYTSAEGRSTATVNEAVRASVFADLSSRGKGLRHDPSVYKAKGITCRPIYPRHGIGIGVEFPI